MADGGSKGGANDDPTLAVSLGYKVRRTFRGFTQSLEERLAPHKISASMWYFLRLLGERDGLTQREISAELGLTPPTTVNAMDILEKRGLIYRNRNAEDRRKTNIFLTRAGRQLALELLPIALDVNRVATQDLSAAEQTTLFGLLERVTLALERDHR